MVRAVAGVAAAILLHGCGCQDIACSHPLGLTLSFPDEALDQQVSLIVAYDDEQRFVSCPPAEGCQVSCGNVACPADDDDVVVSREAGLLEVSIGHMSRDANDTSCRGAESVRIDVSRGRGQFEVVELEVEYERNDDYGGGPGCGVAEHTEARTVALEYR